MAFTELDCDDTALPLEEIRRRAMVLQPDGTWAIQVVIVTEGGGGDFNGDFSNDFNI